MMGRKRWSPTMDRTVALRPGAPVSALYMDDVANIAGAIVNDALEWLNMRRHPDGGEVLPSLLRGDAARREFKLGLARYAAEYLGFLDADVKAVYVYDREASVGTEPDNQARKWTVQLIVWANPKTAALKSLVSALDRALATVLRERVGCVGTECFLDVQLIDSTDLKHLVGYAALLSLPDHRLTRIWRREPFGSSLATEPIPKHKHYNFAKE